MLRCDGQYSLSKDNIVGRLVSNLKTDIFSIFAQETFDGSVHGSSITKSDVLKFVFHFTGKKNEFN